MTELLQADELSMEAVELELALQLQDIAANGFAESVQEAVETAGYRFLFQMPAIDCEGSLRIAAICAGEGNERRILLVHLEEDGYTVRVEPAGDGNDNAYASVADSFAEVLEELGKLQAAA